MAKRKAKKVKVSLVLRFSAFILGVATLCFGFLEGVSFTGKLLGTETTFTGFDAIFGVEDISSFSIMAMLAFVLPFAGGILMISKNNLFNLIATACFIVGAILLFLVPDFIVMVENSILNAYTAKLAVGTILSAVMSILGALVSGYATFFTK